MPYQLKVMNQQFDLYTRQQTAQKNNVIALLDMTFPGINKLFDSQAREDGSQKWVDFADTFWHVDCVRSLSEKKFTERYAAFCKKHHYNFSSAKAAEIYAFAANLFICRLLHQFAPSWRWSTYSPPQSAGTHPFCNSCSGL